MPQGSLNQSSFSIEVSESGNPTLVSRPVRGKGKISDFHSWLSAWNVYISVLSHYSPQLTSQLLGYQAIITRFSSLYSFEAWSTYDRLFRLLVSNNRGAIRWDQVDDNMFVLHLSASSRGSVSQVPGSSRSVGRFCYICRDSGHIATDCPSRRVQSSIQPSSSQPFRAPQPNSLCFYFNDRGHCSRPRCGYARECSNCGSTSHPKCKCPSLAKK